MSAHKVVGDIRRWVFLEEVGKEGGGGGDMYAVIE